MSADSPLGQTLGRTPSKASRRSGTAVLTIPDVHEARNWWYSPADRQIASLWAEHIRSDIILVDGVPDGYDPAKTAAKMRELMP
jgi:hypothetical protein